MTNPNRDHLESNFRALPRLRTAGERGILLAAVLAAISGCSESADSTGTPAAETGGSAAMGATSGSAGTGGTSALGGSTGHAAGIGGTGAVAGGAAGSSGATAGGGRGGTAGAATGGTSGSAASGGAGLGGSAGSSSGGNGAAGDSNGGTAGANAGAGGATGGAGAATGGGAGAPGGQGGMASGTGGNGGAAGCERGGVAANEVVWIGDSWIDIPGNQKTRVNELARAAGALGQNEAYVDLAVSGSPIATIVNQYNTRQAGNTKVKVLLMDGGGIDTIQGGGSEASVSNVENAFEQHLAKVAADGTVEHIVYYLYPELPTIAGVAALRPRMKAACEASTVPCHFLDLQPLWEGHPEYTGGDSIHASQAGGAVIAEAVWKIMQDHCIAQ